MLRVNTPQVTVRSASLHPASPGRKNLAVPHVADRLGRELPRRRIERELRHRGQGARARVVAIRAERRQVDHVAPRVAAAHHEAERALDEETPQIHALGEPRRHLRGAEDALESVAPRGVEQRARVRQLTGARPGISCGNRSRITQMTRSTHSLAIDRSCAGVG